MQATLSGRVASIGYLDTLETESHGMLGALLVVDANARPTEFHCTQPIVPNRAQRVLFGQTLQNHFRYDLIPKALFQKCKSRIDLVIVNDTNLHQIRPWIEIPTGILVESNNASVDGTSSRSEEPSEEGVLIGELSFHHYHGIEFALHSSYAADLATFQMGVDSITRCVDLEEPFERLVIAIKESFQSDSRAA